MSAVDVSKTYIDDTVASAVVGMQSTVPVPVGGVVILATADDPHTVLGYGTWTLLGPGQLVI